MIAWLPILLRRRREVLRQGAWLGAIFYFVLMAMLPLATLVGKEPPWFLTGVAFWGLLVFTLLHSALTWGWKRALGFLVGTGVVTLFFETLGVVLGWPFGPYVYTSSFLGPRVLGVPLLIPLVWYTVAYPSWHLMDRSFRGNPRVPRAIRALASSWALTAWDLLADPLMVRRGTWTWLQSGAYFGIPAQNFVGWLLTGWVLFFLWEKTRPPAGKDALPWAVYTGLAVLYSILAFQANLKGPAVAGGLAMGGMILWSLPHVYQRPTRS